LDRLPYPALDLVPKEKYTIRVFGNDDTVACLETARGCPYACDFCSVTPTWGNKWRNKSNTRILMELDQAKRLGYDWIFFTDDIFVVYPNVKQRMDLFQKMLQHNFGFKWIVQMRADVTALNPELIRLGSEAGMRLAFLGIESGSPEILRKMHKGLFTPQSVKAVRVLSENGVIVLCGMMIGAPYERFRDMTRTVEFSHKLADAGADAIQFTVYTPLPGTRAFDDALRGNKLFTLDWDRYDVLAPVMKTRVHPALIQMLQFYGNYSFYIRKFLMGKLQPHKVKEFKRDLMLIEGFYGLGGGLFWPANTSAIMASSPPARYGVASGIMNTFRNTGMVMSFALSLTAVTGVIPAYIVYQLFIGNFSGTLAPNFAAAYLSGQSFAFELSAILLTLATLFSLVRGKETRHVASATEV